jgi:hypothetical protein
MVSSTWDESAMWIQTQGYLRKTFNIDTPSDNITRVSVFMSGLGNQISEASNVL